MGISGGGGWEVGQGDWQVHFTIVVAYPPLSPPMTLIPRSPKYEEPRRLQLVRPRPPAIVCSNMSCVNSPA